MSKFISKEELKKHTTTKDLWIQIHGQVYNVTNYALEHPGGIDIMLEVAGIDGTDAFEDVGHSAEARERLSELLVGRLEGAPDPHLASAAATNVTTVKSGHAAARPVFVAKPNTLPRADEKKKNPAKRSLISWPLLALAVAPGLLRWIPYRMPLPPWAAALQSPLGTVITIAGTSAVVTAVLVNYAFGMLGAVRPDYSALPSRFKVTLHEMKAHTSTAHGVLDPRRYIELPITKRTELSPDTMKLELALPRPDAILGLPTGQHVSIRAHIDGKDVSRSYTPTSSNKDRGRLELVVKSYADGLMTGQHLSRLQAGDKIEVSGPRGQMRYVRGLARRIGMVAGGSGITPLFQVLRAICEDERDDTRVSLVFANRREEDILLRAQLDRFAREHPAKLAVWYTLSDPPPGWAFDAGRVTRAMLQERLPAPAADTKVMLCGPPGMQKAAKAMLEDLGFARARPVSKATDQLFVF